MHCLAGGSCLEGVTEDSRDLFGWNPRVSDHAEGSHTLSRGGGHCPGLHISLCHPAGPPHILYLHLPAELHHPSQPDLVPAPRMLQVQIIPVNFLQSLFCARSLHPLKAALLSALCVYSSQACLCFLTLQGTKAVQVVSPTYDWIIFSYFVAG